VASRIAATDTVGRVLDSNHQDLGILLASEIEVRVIHVLAQQLSGRSRPRRGLCGLESEASECKSCESAFHDRGS
jgi:hypothetical protein